MATLLLGRFEEENEEDYEQDNFTSSDEEGEGEEVHEQLLENISAFGRKRKTAQRDEAANTVSEYHLVHDKDHDLIQTHDLLTGFKNERQLRHLKQRLTKVDNRSVQLTTPLPTYLKDKIKRKVAYKETSIQISKWDPIIKHNRKTEHLNFPLQEEIPELPSLTTKVDSFKPVTELECAVAAMLEGSDHVIPNDKDLSEAERKALMRMTMEEAKERRRELRRMRVLMSYYEQKCKRMKRIKSKKFRKVQRKKKEKERERREREEEGDSSLEKAERVRAKERATLKHSNLSKWARSQLTKKHRDPATQLALAEQGRLKHELKMKSGDNDSSSDEDDESGVVSEVEGEDSGVVSEEEKEQLQVDKSQHIDTADFLISEPREGVLVTSLQQASQQLLAVQEAFAGDDVVEEFVKEKEEEVERSRPKEIDLTLPGWGNWGGMGTRPSKKRFVIPVDQSTINPRKDSDLRYVIINEQRDKKAARHLVNQLPYPFTSRAQFNHVMATPIGRQWNTETTFNDLVRPRISTAIGAMVEPMKITDEVDQFMKKSQQEVEKKKKRKREMGKRGL